MKTKYLITFLSGIVLITTLGFVFPGDTSIKEKIRKLADEEESKVISWRRDFHQHPELGNREFKTAEKIAAHLKSLGLEVKTGVAHTGVVGILKGGKPGPVIALRADIDGLPVTERADIPFASKAKSTYNGQEVGVMHACGHDTHISILMGVAEVLSKVKGDLKGTVKFIFQPAEEGAPEGEEGGAELMIKEGVLENPKVDVIFGLHINAATEAGKIKYRSGGTMAAVDGLKIKVKGKQSHGAYPWMGADPIVASAQIINALQTIVSRSVNLPKGAAVVTVAMIHGGVRNNIIPEEVNLEGTIRTLSKETQDLVHEKIRQIVTNTAEANGVTAEVDIHKKYPITYNDPPLTAKMLSTLHYCAGKENVLETEPHTGAEDFSFFQQKIPGFYFFLGGLPKGKDPKTAADHHTPDFYIDESGLKLGVFTLSSLVTDYMGL